MEGLLAGLGSLSSRPMFGGHGLYCGGVFFGFVLDDVFYLRADPQAGLKPFVWKGRPSVNYYRAPAEALESPDAALEWARKALAAAIRSRKKK